MSRPARSSRSTNPKSAAQTESWPKRALLSCFTRYGLSVVLMFFALVYAFLAGLHTVGDFDLGWHLATGRYVVQHQTVPSTDVLSYTSPGAEWLYPPFVGVLFYGIFCALGYSGLSWFCALTLVAIVACLLRFPSRRESVPAAALTIIAVPTLAWRINPRPDAFTHLFFAIFLVLLWNLYRANLSNDTPSRAGSPDAPDETAPSCVRPRLWVLPLLMFLWVNFHPGFIAGLGILFAFLLAEGVEALFRSRRGAVLKRLRLAWPPLAATAGATLLNPYGPRIFNASLGLMGLRPTDHPGSGFLVAELQAMPLSLLSFSRVLNWRNPDSSFWWLALSAVLVIALALWRRNFGAALILAASLYVSIQHLRYVGMFSIIVVVVGSSSLAEVFSEREASRWGGAHNRSSLWRVLPVIVVIALCLLTCVRIGDLVSNRYYQVSSSGILFGPGESGLFPERAAAFIQRVHLPGNIFHTYELGGFTAWRLGPDYGDFIDGRNVSPAVMTEYQKTMSSLPDSQFAETESAARNINVLFLPKSRFYNLTHPSLASLCQSQLWRPIYLDEVSIVLVRNRPENRSWIDRYAVDCRTHQFTPPSNAPRKELSNFYANEGTLLMFLGRAREAKVALDQAATLSPEDANIRVSLALLYEAQQDLGSAELEYKATISMKEDWEAGWFGLGRLYASQGRFSDARLLVLTAIQLSIYPANEYMLLGVIDLALQQPQSALADFDKAEETSGERRGVQLDRNFLAQIAEGRAGAYSELGEWQRAIEFQQAAIQWAPEDASAWMKLAAIYEKAGHNQLAEQAREQARSLSK